MEQPGKQEDELTDLPPLEAGLSDDEGLGAFDDLGMEPLDLGDIDLGSDDGLGDLSDGGDDVPGMDLELPDEPAGDLDLDADLADAAAVPLSDLEAGDDFDLNDGSADLSDSFDEAPVLEDAPGFDDFGDASDALSLEGDEPLSDDELTTIMPLADSEAAGDSVAAVAHDGGQDDESVTGTSFFDETEDETVALSEDELEDILGHTDETFFEDFTESEDGADDSAAAALQSEEGQMELGEVASSEDLVPEPELHPIAPLDSDSAPADAFEAAPLDEMSFDDFDAPADSAPADEPATEESLEVAPFTDDDLELELSDGSDLGDDLSDFGTDDNDMEAESAVPGFLEEGDDDEPIALSEDELDNIMGDVEMAETEPGEHLGDALPLDALGDEEFATDLSDDLAAGDDELNLDANEEDENITLSDDELSQVLLDSESGEGEDDGALMAEDSEPLEVGEAFDMGDDDVLDLGDEPALSGEGGGFEDEDLPDAPSLSSLDMDDDEPIALTAEELGNIVSEVETDEVSVATGMEPEADDLEMLDDMPFDDSAIMDDAGDFGATEEADEDLSPDLAGFDAAEEEGPVALSDSELGSILEDTDTETVSAEGQTPPDEDMEFGEVAGEADEFADGNVIVLDEYEEAAADEPVVPGPPEVEDIAGPEPEPEPEESDSMVGGAVAAAAAAGAAAAGVGLAERAERIAAGANNLDREELRTMISYLDGLFDALPDDAVQKFSQSSYFDLYKKIMSELGLGD